MAIIKAKILGENDLQEFASLNALDWRKNRYILRKVKRVKPLLMRSGFIEKVHRKQTAHSIPKVNIIESIKFE